MTVLSLLLVAFALSLDAFAVSISCGIKLERVWARKYIKIALSFGAAQAIMPFLGWSMGHLIKEYVEAYAMWIAGSVFLVLGIKTIRDSLKRDGGDVCVHCTCSNMKCLTSLAIATSIDAFIVGLILAFYNVSLWMSLGVIGLITFAMSILGCFIGHRSGRWFGKRATFLAGLILIGLAVKVVLEKTLS